MEEQVAALQRRIARLETERAERLALQHQHDERLRQDRHRDQQQQQTSSSCGVADHFELEMQVLELKSELAFAHADKDSADADFAATNQLHSVEVQRQIEANHQLERQAVALRSRLRELVQSGESERKQLSQECEMLRSNLAQLRARCAAADSAAQGEAKRLRKLQEAHYTARTQLAVLKQKQQHASEHASTTVNQLKQEFAASLGKLSRRRAEGSVGDMRTKVSGLELQACRLEGEIATERAYKSNLEAEVVLLRAQLQDQAPSSSAGLTPSPNHPLAVQQQDEKLVEDLENRLMRVEQERSQELALSAAAQRKVLDQQGETESANAALLLDKAHLQHQLDLIKSARKAEARGGQYTPWRTPQAAANPTRTAALTSPFRLVFGSPLKQHGSKPISGASTPYTPSRSINPTWRSEEPQTPPSGISGQQSEVLFTPQRPTGHSGAEDVADAGTPNYPGTLSSRDHAGGERAIISHPIPMAQMELEHGTGAD